MDLRNAILAIEDRARACSYRIDDMCRDAGISRITWQRWKNGSMSPTLAHWQAVEDVLAARERERQRGR